MGPKVPASSRQTRHGRKDETKGKRQLREMRKRLFENIRNALAGDWKSIKAAYKIRKTNFAAIEEPNAWKKLSAEHDAAMKQTIGARSWPNKRQDVQKWLKKKFPKTTKDSPDAAKEITAADDSEQQSAPSAPSEQPARNQVRLGMPQEGAVVKQKERESDGEKASAVSEKALEKMINRMMERMEKRMRDKVDKEIAKMEHKMNRLIVEMGKNMDKAIAKKKKKVTRKIMKKLA